MGEAAVGLLPEAAMFGGEAAGIGLVDAGAGASGGLFEGLFGAGEGLFGTGLTAGTVASGLSLGSLALGGIGSFMQGQGAAEQQQRASQNYLYQGAAKALNYRLEGETRATNYLADSATRAANYEYAGAAEEAQRGMEASGYGVSASRARRAAEFGRTQASLTDVTMREDLARTLGGIETTRAAAHTDIDSPTGAAFVEHERMLGDRQRQAALLTINTQVGEDEASAAYYDAAAKFALGQGANAKAFADYNASVARTMGAYNAEQSRRYAAMNAQIAERSAGLSSEAALAAGSAAETAGNITGISKILAGIGKAFA